MTNNFKKKEKKIFIVDDDSSILNIMEDMLIGENYDVYSFAAGKDAVENTEKEKPDIVILDYYLPGENAEEIVEKLRLIAGNHLPIILISASMQIEQKAEKLLVSDFIEKPFQRQVLLDVIKKNLK